MKQVEGIVYPKMKILDKLEKPIELGNSWFSAKSIQVERNLNLKKGRALYRKGWPKALPILSKLRIFFKIN